jgi:hypothetical protein
VTKANRRRQRPGTQPPTARPTGSPPSSSANPPNSASQTGASTAGSSASAGLPVSGATTGGRSGTAADAGATGAGGGTGAGGTGAAGAGGTTGGTATTGGAATTTRPGTTSGAATTSGTRPSTAGAAGATTATTSGRPSSTARTTRPSTSASASGSARAGRRDRARVVQKRSFLERYRTAIVAVAALAGVALIAAFVLFSATQPAYACTNVWTPSPTPAPTAGATQALGYVQPDQGRNHITGFVTYTYCAPASGPHINASGAGPIAPRVYGPGDAVKPEGWIHNLEHGGLVVLYRGDSAGATADGQTQLRAFYDSFPNSPVCNMPKGVVGPVVARFDQMSTPFQAIVWGRVLPLETFDQAQVLAFYQQWGDKTNPEPQCSAPSPSASAAESAAPSGSAAPASASPAASSAGPSVAPASTNPSTAPSPS